MKINITKITGLINESFSDFAILDNVEVWRISPKSELEKTEKSWQARGEFAKYQHIKQVVSSERYKMRFVVSRENDFTNIYKGVETKIIPDALEAELLNIGTMILLDSEITITEREGEWVFEIEFTPDGSQDVVNLVSNATLTGDVARAYPIDFTVKNPTIFVPDAYIRTFPDGSNFDLAVIFYDFNYQKIMNSQQFYCVIQGYNSPPIKMFYSGGGSITGNVVMRSFQHVSNTIDWSQYHAVTFSKYSDYNGQAKLPDVETDFTILTKFKPKVMPEFKEETEKQPNGIELSNNLEVKSFVSVPFVLEYSELSLAYLLAQAKSINLGGYKSLSNVVSFTKKDTELFDAVEFELNFPFIVFTHNKFE